MMNIAPALNFKDDDLKKVTKLILLQIDHVTCVQCCKYFTAPETASCGHTLCHMCWSGFHKCPHCMKPVERHTLRRNCVIKNHTEHVQTLADAFESLYKVKVSEVLFDEEPDNDVIKNVSKWLANSQNHFSAPANSSERLPEKKTKLHASKIVSLDKIQIHTSTSQSKQSNKNPEKTIYVPMIPDDLDKIEIMPETEDINKKGKENVIGPMDIEPFYIEEDNEYTASNPRRSSRKRELKTSNEKNNANEIKVQQNINFKKFSEEADKKSNKAKQNWSSVKRMRKEFSKLNKQNRNKLNVSIEMCKRTLSEKTMEAFPATFSAPYYIDGNTPGNNLLTKEIEQNVEEDKKNKETTDSPQAISNSFTNVNAEIENPIHVTTNVVSKQGSDKEQSNSKHGSDSKINLEGKNNDNQRFTHKEGKHFSKDEVENDHMKTIRPMKMPFYKRSALKPKDVATTNKTVNHIIESDSNLNDDINITIQAGSTVTNILIKKKNNKESKINVDRAIQTSLCPREIDKKSYPPNNSQAQNIVIHVSESHEIDVKHQAISSPRVQEIEKDVVSDKTQSEKKNTDSADTATVQFEITESVEKELSKVMDIDDNAKPGNSKTTTAVDEQSVKNNNMLRKALSEPDEYLNDVDIFDSESVKEPQVQCLKDTENAPSEILFCTYKTRNKTQKVTEKRFRGTSNEDILPKSKKPKCNDKSVIANATVVRNESKLNQPESEPMNYDAIMGTVFASIDADMEEIRQSQNIIKNTLENNNVKSRNKILSPGQSKITQEANLPAAHVTSQLVSKCKNQGNSENIFSVGAEKDGDNVDAECLTSTNKKMPESELQLNIDEFVTPVVPEADVNDVQMLNDDDSDKSVVEETPQKALSFIKAKQKSNGANKEVNQTQRLEVSNPNNDTSEVNLVSIVSVADTSTEIRTDDNVTAIKIVDRKPTDTPLNIDTFFNQIQHKSTPFAKKSLNFVSQNVDDVTICGTNDVVGNTTQEREIMIKAFEKTPTVATVRPQNQKNLMLNHRKYVIAGSCLDNSETANLKRLCARNKWSYSNTYLKDITHLVVGTDEENKAQRTIKFMCALASSKWIVSYEWVVKSLQSNDFVNEDQYEVLDSTGHPGPMLSRTATRKLLEGITFYCMEPFGILDVNTLKDLIISAGGTVVEEMKQVRVGDNTSGPALLLAEPEDTQVDRFIYLAYELSIVPVNYEWVLNCLGCYTLNSIQGLLLCPASILPKAISYWPKKLLANDDDSNEDE